MNPNGQIGEYLWKNCVKEETGLLWENCKKE